MTHYSAETLDEITDDELARRYDSFLDDHGLYDGLNIDGVELVPSEVLKCTDPTGYQDCLNTYINSLYEIGELTSEWDREDTIKELCQDWTLDVFGEVLDNTTKEEDETITNTLTKLYDRGVLVIEYGELTLDYQHTMTEVLIALGTALNETKNN